MYRTQIVALLLVVIAVLGLATNSQASPILVVDQQNPAGSGDFITVNPLAQIGNGPGQSFTPTLGRVDAVEVQLVSDGTGTSTARLDLFLGAGFGGTLVGSSGTQTFGNTLTMVHFDISAELLNSVYTFRVVHTAGEFFKSRANSSNPYAGGNIYNHVGTSFALGDIVFREGLHKVPEPSTIAMLGAGLLGLFMRRKRVA